MSWLMDYVVAWVQARLHSCYKLAVRLYTGRCELERIALATPPSSSGSSDADLQRKVELSRSLRASSQLSAYFAPIYGSQSMPRSRPQKVAIRAIASVEEVKEESAKLAHTIITVKRINKHSAVESVLKSAVRSIVDVNHLLYQLQAAATTAYDESNPRHEKRLLQLWSLLRPGVKLSARRSSDWEQLGFQGENPATDFRAMGLLGLSNLIAFADVCGLDAGRLLQESRDGGLRWFSYAITGINLTADLVKLTRERALDEYYFRHGASPQSFHALYCIFFVRFNEAWTKAKPASVMEFSTIHSRFLERVRFEAPYSWKEGYEFLEPLVAVDKFPATLD